MVGFLLLLDTTDADHALGARMLRTYCPLTVAWYRRNMNVQKKLKNIFWKAVLPLESLCCFGKESPTIPKNHHLQCIGLFKKSFSFCLDFFNCKMMKQNTSVSLTAGSFPLKAIPLCGHSHMVFMQWLVD